jgi:DNA-binding NtrC family response regulator
VRFVAATNRDLEAEIVRGTFRQDLFFRLNGATLVIPPLRERPAEIAGLAHTFVELAAPKVGLARAPELSRDALAALMRYPWPGNIRELRNMMERAVLLSGESPITTAHLPLEKMRATFAATGGGGDGPRASGFGPRPEAAAKPGPPRPLVASPVLRRGPHLTPDEERTEIESALAACGGNQTRAAKMLGIARRTLINRIHEFGLARPRK